MTSMILMERMTMTMIDGATAIPPTLCRFDKVLGFLGMHVCVPEYIADGRVFVLTDWMNAISTRGLFNTRHVTGDRQNVTDDRQTRMQRVHRWKSRYTHNLKD